MTAQFGRRAKRDAQAPDELRRARQGVSLSDVRRYRERRATDLIAQRKVPGPRGLQGQAVRSDREVLACSPCVEGLELSHGATLGAAASADAIDLSRDASLVRTTFPVFRFPLHASRGS